jgi:hypothetical protein
MCLNRAGRKIEVYPNTHQALEPVMQSALIVDAVVLAAVLQADLGQHRKIDRSRLVRPMVIAAGIVPLFVEAVVTHGNGLVLEVALAGAGIVLGLVATWLMTVYRSADTHLPVSGAGRAYAALWIAVIGARAAFTYGSSNWFGPQLDHWMIRSTVTGPALTDGLVFMAVAMIVTRTVAMSVRARHLPTPMVSGTAGLLQAA